MKLPHQYFTKGKIMVITIRAWVDAALQFSSATCEHCGEELELYWFDDGLDENEPVLWYVACRNPNCKQEHSIVVAFVPEKPPRKKKKSRG